MPVTVTRTVRETEALGERLGRLARAGEVYGLCGDLGAGKTAWVRGFARGLGFTGRVRSPTFSLVNEYSGGRLPVHHLDLYRLSGPAEVLSAGLEEFLAEPDGVSVVEWVERWITGSAAVGSGVRWIRFLALDETTREIVHDDPGA